MHERCGDTAYFLAWETWHAWERHACCRILGKKCVCDKACMYFMENLEQEPLSMGDVTYMNDTLFVAWARRGMHGRDIPVAAFLICLSLRRFR